MTLLQILIAWALFGAVIGYGIYEIAMATAPEPPRRGEKRRSVIPSTEE